MTEDPKSAEDAPDLLLWLDLETTGSDEQKDSIIEVGCILTTLTLDVIAAESWLVFPTDEALGRLMRSSVVREMHAQNDLLDLVLGGAGSTPHEVAKRIVAWLRDNRAPERRTILAGSGVAHFDRRFLARWMPQIDNYLRYWCIDVGVLRRSYEMWAGASLSTANDAKTHRALDDAYCHLAEAREFAALFASLRRPEVGRVP